MELVSCCVSTTTDTPDGAGRLFSVAATPPPSVASGSRPPEPPRTKIESNKTKQKKKSQSHVSISVLAGEICAEFVCSRSYQLKNQKEGRNNSIQQTENGGTSFNRICVLVLTSLLTINDNLSISKCSSKIIPSSVRT